MHEIVEKFRSALEKFLPEEDLPIPDDQGNVHLKERSADMEVAIVDLPSSPIAVDVRRLSHLPRLNEGDWIQQCDYFLICCSESKILATIVELKKTLGNEEKPNDQLRRSLPIFQYLRFACEVESEFEIDDTDLTIQYVVIGKRLNPRLDKQRVRAHPLQWQREIQYKQITVRRFVGSRIPFGLFST